MKSPELLPHQQSAVNVINKQIIIGTKRLLISMPPGTGKANTIMGVIDELQTVINNHVLKILLITSNTALQQQLLFLLKEDQQKYDIVHNANNLYGDRPQIGVCTVQSLMNKDDKMRPSGASSHLDVIIALEIGPDTPSLKIILSNYPKAIQIAFVNNPVKSEWFGEPVWIYTLSEAVKDHVLNSFIVKQFVLDSSDTNVKYDQIMHNQTYIDNAVKYFLSEIKAQRAIVYCPSVDFATRFADELNRIESGVAITIHAGIHLGERRRIIRSYEADERPIVLCTASVLGDFKELASTRTIAIFKKTSSPTELLDMLIPCILPYTAKEQGIVLDFAGLQELFKSLQIDNTVEVRESGEQYFKKADIRFRDKKDIEGVLGVDELAEELAEIITMMPAEQGSMIGIFGKWGRGKTFLIDLTWKILKAKNKINKVDFHAWKYQDTPATWAYLYECLTEAYSKPDINNKILNWCVGVWRIFCLNIKRKGPWPILKFMAIISAGIIAGILSKELFRQLNDNLETWLNGLGISLISFTTAYALFVSVKKEYSSKAKDLFIKYSTKHSFKEHLGIQAEIQKETLTLLKTWIPEKKLKDRKVILFVEDIDRCNEIKIIQIIDSLRVLLEDPEIAKRIVIVTAVDERMLKLAIKMKYHALVSLDKADDGKESDKLKALNSMVNEYIDKLFIAGLKLGNLSLTESDEFFLALTKVDRTEEKTNSLADILTEDRNREYARYSQQIRDNELDQSIIDAELSNYDDGVYEEPDFATDFLQGSQSLVQHSEAGTSDEDTVSRKLGNEEINILRLGIAKYKNVTPRQIRVFYYRYLIAKNLLIRRYVRLNRTNVWQTPDNCRIVANLIVAYTINDKDDILDQHLISSLENQQETQKVELMNQTMINSFDYQQLLKVLSIVIAY